MAAVALAALATARCGWAVTNSTWDGNVIAGNWAEGLRWSTNPVFPNNGQPSAGDTYNATITAGNVGLNQNITIESFIHAGLNSSPNTNDIENFSTTTNTLTLNGLYDWSGGDMEGNVTIAANGGINISGTNLKRMPVRNSGPTPLIPTINNSAAAVWSGAGVNSTVLSIGPDIFYATFNNLSGSTFDAQSDNFFNVQVNNSGNFNRTTGAGTVRFQLPFNNNGTVTVSSGGLELNTGGASSGTFIVNAGRRLFLHGSHTLSASSVVTGAGTVQFSNPSGQGTPGTAIIGGSYNPAATVIDDRLQFDTVGSTGTLVINNQTSVATIGSGTLNVTSPATYQWGNFAGNITVNAQAGMSFAINTSPSWNGNAKLNLGGTSTWTGAFTTLNFADNSQLNVLSGATFTLNDAIGTRTIRTFTTGGNFSNAGTLSKSGNASTLSIEIPATNSGTVIISGGTIAFTNGLTSSGRLEVGAAGSLRFSGGTAPNMTTTGSSVVGAGSVSINNGSLSVAGSYNVGTSEPLSATSLIAAPGANNILVQKTLLVAGSAGNWQATVDLNDNDLMIDYSAASPLATTMDQVAYARHGGAWDRPGITSTAAKNHALQATSLGVMEGTDYRSVYGINAVFDGVSVDNTSVLIKYTWYGDTDFNGKVDGADYARIDTTFNNQALQGNIGGWFNGDLDGNGKVDGADYALIDGAFNSQSVTLRPGRLISVPEPAGILSGGVAILLAARRRTSIR